MTTPATSCKPIRDYVDEKPYTGVPFRTMTCPVEMWPMMLVGKGHEELQEIAENPKDISEYGDLMQVLLDLAAHNGFTFYDVEAARLRKLGERGGYTLRKVLVRP